DLHRHPLLFPYTTLFRSQDLSCISAAYSTSRSELRFRIQHQDLSCISAAYSTSRSELRFCSLFHIKIRGAFPQLIPHQDQSCVRSEEHTSELQSLRHLVC